MHVGIRFGTAGKAGFVGGLHQHFGAVVAEDGTQGLVGPVNGLAGALQSGDGGIVERAAQVQLDGFVVGQ